MGLFRKNKVETTPELDADVEQKLKKYPRKVRKKLRLLYQEYKKGNLVFPEGFDKDKVLNKD